MKQSIKDEVALRTGETVDKLRAAAPQLHADLHAALARTVRNATGVPAAPRCWGYVAEGRATGTQVTAPWRAYAEMLYSGALSAQHVRTALHMRAHAVRVPWPVPPTARAVPLHKPDGTRNELTGASPCTATGTRPRKATTAPVLRLASS